MVGSKPRIKVSADIAKNRLNITIKGNVDKKSLESLYTDIRFCVADLKKGFEVVNDISQCNMLYINSLPVYKKIMDFLAANNVGGVVRIVKDNNLSSRQMLNFIEKIQCYKAMYAEDEREAEYKLDQLMKRSGIRFKFNELFIEYNINNDKGSGRVIDISTSGCSVESSTLPLQIGDEIAITLHFDRHDTLLAEFTFKSQVVRADEGIFAVHFTDVDDGCRKQLYQRLTYEVSRTTCFC